MWWELRLQPVKGGAGQGKHAETWLGLHDNTHDCARNQGED